MSQAARGVQKLLFLHNSRFIRKASSSIISKEIISQHTRAPVAASSDLLINNLKNAKTVHNVFELLQSHHQTMSTKHSMQALRSLFTLQKTNRGEISSQDILKHPEFERLCTQLKQQAGIIETRDALDALKVLTYIGVPSDALIYQVLLQLVRHSVNHLSLRQIIFLDFILKQVKSTPLGEALQIALPVVFEVQLPIKMDRSKIQQLAENLHFISKKNMSEKCIEIVTNALMACEETWDAKSTLSIIWSICDLKPNWSYEKVLSKAFHSMMAHIDSASYEDLDTTLSKIVLRYSNKMPFYYDEELFNVVASIVAENDFGFEQAVYTLKKFLKVGHISNELLDYVAKKCHQNRDLITNGDPQHVYFISGTAALTDFRPNHWASLKQALLNIQTFDNYKGQEFLLGLATSFCILDVYNVNILRKCLDINSLQLMMNRLFFPNFDNLLLVYQAVKAFRPELVCFLPDESFMQKVTDLSNQVRNFPLEGSLCKILGGEQYVKSNLRSKMFHHIDHAIVLRKGGYPVAINTSSDKVCLEDLDVMSEAQLVAVLALQPWHYTLNCKRLRGSTSLMIKTLEASGCSVVPISMVLWNSMPEYEKLPYIADAIKSRTGYTERLETFM